MAAFWGSVGGGYRIDVGLLSQNQPFFKVKVVCKSCLYTRCGRGQPWLLLGPVRPPAGVEELQQQEDEGELQTPGG